MADEEIRAKVFISCGQRKQPDEASVAQEIERKLTELGYDAYIAVAEQSALGVKENIFGQLESSEYFLFIDFKREQLANETFCRGSLFSHQELAVASYLNKELVAFQEDGVKKHDGLMGFLHINATPFTDRKQLPNLVMDEIKKRKWNSRWKDRLVLERETQHRDTTIVEYGKMTARYFHISVRNLNQRRMARNCYAYLERAHQLPENVEIRVPTIEFTWAGYRLPNAVIGSGSTRRFDAFYVLTDNPSQLQFQTFSTSTEFIPVVRGKGDFHLTYSVVSENFPPARRTYAVHVSDRLEDLRFEAIDD